MKRKPACEIGATEFKARCLELMREVEQGKRGPLTVTRRGRPQVKVVAVRDEAQPLYGCLRGQVRVRGDLTEPVDVEWDALTL